MTGNPARRWCFTLFEEDINALTSLEILQVACEAGEVRKAVWQEEHTQNGRTHIQGFFVLTKPQRLKGIKEWLQSSSIHLEVAKGTDQDNLKYCTKVESATGLHKFQHGNFASGQGQRSDLEVIANALKQGQSLEQIAHDYTEQMIKYSKGIIITKQMLDNCNIPDSYEKTVIVIWGKSGAGKSLWARAYAKARNLKIYSKNPGQASQTQWFDGYDGEEVLLLDDFDPQQVPYRELLIWLDVYKHRIQTKGSFAMAKWHTVIITSNINPNDWYIGENMSRGEREPLTRRLDNILEAPMRGWVTEKYNINDQYKSRKPFIENIENFEEKQEQLQRPELRRERKEDYELPMLPYPLSPNMEYSLD